VPIVLKSESLKLLEPYGPVQACNGIALPFVSMRKAIICFVYLSDQMEQLGPQLEDFLEIFVFNP